MLEKCLLPWPFVTGIEWFWPAKEQWLNSFQMRLTEFSEEFMCVARLKDRCTAYKSL